MLSRDDHLLGLYIRNICTTKVVSISLTSCEIPQIWDSMWDIHTLAQAQLEPDGLPLVIIS